ncbi:hypothetical protein lerEdw1_011062 [Lerista edwardsae]|nr:hypothetical protein lerEdw1_011062 [Lerista edwardsae]
MCGWDSKVPLFAPQTRIKGGAAPASQQSALGSRPAACPMDGRFPWPAFWAPPQQEWGWPPGDSSGSPSSSPGSGSLSPAESPLCSAAPRQGPGSRALWRSCAGAPKGGRGARLGPGPRQSASQREKLRMRRLAKALHTLRRYLPPSVAPAGQSLTKIETLRLAIRYIGHLSELLGLSEEALARREPPLARRCHLCPPGLGCCQPEPERPAQERQAAAAAEICCWSSPPCGPVAPAFLDPSSPEGTAGPSRPRAGASPVAAAASWLSAAYCSDGGNSAARSGAGAEELLLPEELADLGLSEQVGSLSCPTPFAA